MKHDHIWRVVGFVAVCYGVFTRLVALGRLPLWADELASLQRAQLPLAEHWRLIDKRPPLFELLLRHWAPDMTIADAQLRLPWAVLGAAAIWVTWRLGRRMAGDQGGAVAAWIMALSPLHLLFSRIARTYGMATLLAALSLYLLWRHHTTKRRVYMALYVVVTVAALYANVLMCGVVLGQNVFMFITYRDDRRALIRWVAMQAVLGLFFAPWLATSFLGAARFAGQATYTPAQLGAPFKVAYLAFALCLGETVHPLDWGVVVPAAVGFGGVLIAAIVRCVQRDRSTGLFLAAPIVCTAVPALFFSAAAPKHLMLLLPPLAVFLAIGLVRVQRTYLRAGLAALIAGTCVYGQVNYFARRDFADASMTVPWREIASDAEAYLDPADRLFIGWRTRGERFGSDAALFKRYYDGEAPVACLAPDTWREQLRAALARHGRIALLLHRAEPREAIAAWLQDRAEVRTSSYLLDEETLVRLKEGGERSSHVFILYRAKGGG